MCGTLFSMITIFYKKILKNSKQKGLSYSRTPEYHPQSKGETFKDRTKWNSAEQ